MCATAYVVIFAFWIPSFCSDSFFPTAVVRFPFYFISSSLLHPAVFIEYTVVCHRELSSPVIKRITMWYATTSKLWLQLSNQQNPICFSNYANDCSLSFFLLFFGLIVEENYCWWLVESSCWSRPNHQHLFIRRWDCRFPFHAMTALPSSFSYPSLRKDAHAHVAPLSWQSFVELSVRTQTHPSP